MNKATTSPQLPKHILSLTSTRFIASFAIVLYHAKDKMGFEIEQYTHLLKNAYVAVDFFFILSGFIIAHSYGNKVQQGTFKFLDFMKRRFARIYPVHLFTLAAFCVLGILFHILNITPNIPEKYSIEAVPINLLLLQAWGLTEVGTFNTPSWSISAEWFAYLLFLPFFLLLLKLNKLIAFAMSIIMMIAFYVTIPMILGTSMPELASNFGILRILPEFFYGITLYLLLVRYIPSKTVSSYLWVGGVIGVMLCLHFNFLNLITIFLFGLLIYALAARSCYGQKNILDKRALVYGGSISYSMYMIHALIFTLAFNGWEIFLKDISPTQETVIWTTYIITVFPASIILFHFIEEPSRKFINNLKFLSDSQKN